MDNQITKLSPRIKHFSLSKMFKHYSFLCNKAELTPEEVWGKKRLKRYIEISLQDNGEWKALLAFTDDMELAVSCALHIDILAEVEAALHPLEAMKNKFLNNSFNFN